MGNGTNDAATGAGKPGKVEVVIRVSPEIVRLAGILGRDRGETAEDYLAFLLETDKGNMEDQAAELGLCDGGTAEGRAWIEDLAKSGGSNGTPATVRGIVTDVRTARKDGTLPFDVDDGSGMVRVHLPPTAETEHLFAEDLVAQSVEVRGVVSMTFGPTYNGLVMTAARIRVLGIDRDGNVETPKPTGTHKVRTASVTVEADGKPYTFEVWEIGGAHGGLPQFLVHDGVEVKDVLTLLEDGETRSMARMADAFKKPVRRAILDAFGYTEADA